jgi:hypothetical protein
MSEADSPAECPICGKQAERLPSVFASKDGYTLRVPRAGAFRSGQSSQG